MSMPIVPEPQPNDPPILTVREYLLDPKRRFQVVAIHDGWKPLCVRSLEHALYLVALVDTGKPEAAEVLHLVTHGEDLRATARLAVELAFLGHTVDGRYLFLEVQPEPSGAGVRRIGRTDLE